MSDSFELTLFLIIILDLIRLEAQFGEENSAICSLLMRGREKKEERRV